MAVQTRALVAAARRWQEAVRACQPDGVTDQRAELREPDPEQHEGLSAFASRVLGQLSLSAWLPAAFSTVLVTVLLAMRFNGTLSLRTAIATMVADPWAFILLAGPILVCATLLIQAFSFEAIKFLEGYSHLPLIGVPVSALLTRRQVALRRWNERRRKVLHRRAWRDARADWIDAGFDHELVAALEADAHELTRPPLTDAQQDEISDLEWWHRADPWLMARIDRRRARLAEFPALTSRTLPTRLGNILRATEDDLSLAANDVEGFVMRLRGRAPLRLRVQHDQFRTRLDMYCVLTLGSFALAIISPLILWTIPTDPDQLWSTVWGWSITRDMLIRTGIVASLLVIGWASYKAAIASARGYVTILRQMDQL